MTQCSNISEFAVDIADASLEDLRSRLNNARWPEPEPVDDWSMGTPLGYLQSLCQYWANEYDGQRVATRLNQWPQFVADIDDVKVHFLHIRSSHADAPALVMTHGWPGSVVEFLKVIEAFTEPERHGGTAADAFHLVIPALPGFGFSTQPTVTGWSIEKIADAWSALMKALGYDAFYAQGGDWGSGVTTAIGTRHPDRCLGIHTNMPIVAPAGKLLEDLTPFEEDALKGRKFYRDWDSGYSKQQSTRPQSVGYGLVDSPVGLAGWIIEKFYQWTDCDGHPENVLTRDELLDNLMMYWLPATGASSARLYWESFGRGEYNPVQVPSGASIFPKEIFKSSERWVRSRYVNLQYFNVLETGGHFAALEQPELFVAEVRAAFRAIRDA